MKRPWSAFSLAFGVIIASSGCYKYVPDQQPTPVLGAEYRAHLNQVGQQSLAPYLGSSVVVLDGRFIAERDSAWTVAVSATRKRDDTRSTVWTGEVVTLPRVAVERFERRELDRPRTLRAVALSVAGGIAVGGLLYAIGGKVSGSGNPGPGPIMP